MTSGVGPNLIVKRETCAKSTHPEIRGGGGQPSLGPLDPSFRALSGHLEFTVRRDKFNKDSLALDETVVIHHLAHQGNASDPESFAEVDGDTHGS